MKPKAIIFDMDGVLVDVSKSYRLAIKETAEFFSKEKISFEEIQDMKNIGGYNNDWDLTEGILLTKNVNISKNLIIAKFQELYLGNNFDGYIKNEKWLLDKNLLRKLYNRYDLAVVTGRPREEAEHALERFGVKELFKAVIVMEDLPEDKQKPNPYGLNVVLERLKTNDAIYFGDTIDDMEMGNAAGIKAVGILPPGINGKLKELLIESGANIVLEDINKIEEVLR